jgi:hypothetical protein
MAGWTYANGGYVGGSIPSGNASSCGSNDNSPIVQIIDQRQGGAPVQQTEKTGPNGKKTIQVMIRDEVQRA